MVLIGLTRTHTAAPTFASLSKLQNMDSRAPIWAQKSTSSIKWAGSVEEHLLKQLKPHISTFNANLLRSVPAEVSFFQYGDLSVTLSRHINVSILVSRNNRWKIAHVPLIGGPIRFTEVAINQRPICASIASLEDHQRICMCVSSK